MRITRPIKLAIKVRMWSGWCLEQSTFQQLEGRCVALKPYKQLGVDTYLQILSV